MTGDAGPASPAGPEPVSRSEHEAFTALVARALPETRASAQAWRNGLSALITLVAAGAVISGHTTAAAMPTGWRLAVTVTIGGSLALAMRGLWLALAAEAGSRSQPQTLEEIHAHHATVAAYEVALANRAAQRLQTARDTTAVALALLLGGIILTWWAPSTPEPQAYVSVTTSSGTSCGILQSSSGDLLRLQVTGRAVQTRVPIADVTAITVLSDCPQG